VGFLNRGTIDIGTRWFFVAGTVKFATGFYLLMLPAVVTTKNVSTRRPNITPIPPPVLKAIGRKEGEREEGVK
jgi:hypothetical protein